MQHHVKIEGPSVASSVTGSLHCVQRKDAIMLRDMAKQRGPRGSRSPCPEWWVAEANRRLAHRGLSKKRLARALAPQGISEMMVLRCLLDDPEERIPTIEAITAISRALGLPLPVVIAGTMEQARELESLATFTEFDARALALASESSDGGDDARVGDERSKEAQQRFNRAVDEGGPRAPGSRSSTVRRRPRPR